MPESRAGVLILVVGPSGAGKDTLIDHVRRTLADENVSVARRIVTRAATPDEPHDTLDPEAFEAAAARGEFALRWHAHGLDYAIPAAIDRQLARGDTVICNVSRGAVAALRARYERTSVIYVDAPLALRQARIAGRRRVGEAPERARRSQTFEPSDADHVVVNDRSLEEACLAFEAAVRVSMAKRS